MAAKKRKYLPWVLFILGVGIVLTGTLGYRYYQWIYAPNVELGEREYVNFYVPSGMEHDELRKKLKEKDFLKDYRSFRWVAEQKGFTDEAHSGKYRVRDGMSNDELIDILRGGLEETVKVTFNNVRTKEDLAGKATRNIELDSAQLLRSLKDEEKARSYGFSSETFLVMFIPDTYEFYWDVGVDGFLDRMKKAYEDLWTEERRNKAGSLDLTPVEVSILASIVEAEQLKVPEERPKVARLFLNRLDRGMKLESDPTLIYAMGDFSINRVLDKDRDVDSPYNTYRYKGLPPGPIRLPSKRSIRSVLNPSEHDDIYMCAKPDSSGLHNFTSSYSQHLRNARKYQSWLSEKGVYR